MSAAAKGKKKTPEHIENLKLSRKGYKWSEATRQRMSTIMPQTVRASCAGSEITFNGEILFPHEWAKRAGIPVTTFKTRIRKGWLMMHVLGLPGSPFRDPVPQ